MSCWCVMQNERSHIFSVVKWVGVAKHCSNQLHSVELELTFTIDIANIYQHISFFEAVVVVVDMNGAEICETHLRYSRESVS